MRDGDRVGGRFVLREGPVRSGDGISDVWLAHDERMGRDVVLKRVSEQPLGELRAMAKLSHQHVVTLYEYLSVPGEGADAGDWLVMEYAPRGSLAEQPPMSPEQAARVGAQIASALVDLHAKGIVHCDVKPANIVLTDSGIAKLTDFGAAFRVDDEETISPDTRISYTPAYAAPELVRGNPTRTSDVYSLATTVHALVTGASPHAPSPDESTADLGPLADPLTVMRQRDPDERPDAARAQRMFEDIAAGVDPSVARSEKAPDGTVVPAQLPADVYGFAGRDDELDRLGQLLAAATDEPTAVVICTVTGTAGIGKTTLAVHWAHRIADRFPDGQLYVNLRGFDPDAQVLDPSTAVRGFLEALGTAQERIPADLNAQTALYRTLLVGKKVLVVLDNARDTNQLRPLLPGTPGCLVLATSRNDLGGLVTREGAHPLALGLLTNAEARHLLERRLGAERTAAEPDAVDDILAACARLPLALAIVAARAATRPSFPLAALAAELRESNALDALATEGPDSDVRAVFSWSYRQLTPEAARLFRLLGLHPGPHLSAPAAASLAGIPPHDVRPLLAELTRTNLLTEHTPGRYTFHDLLRAYAGELAHTHDTETERQTARERMLDHYLHTAYAADRQLDPHSRPIDLAAPHPDVTPERPTDYEQALEWFTTEHVVLLAVIEHSSATGFDSYAWQLSWTLDVFLNRRGHWHDRTSSWRIALASARRLGDGQTEARAHRFLGQACRQLNLFEEAYTHLQQALDLYDELGDLVQQGHTHRILAMVLERQDRFAEALDHAQRALELYRTAEARSYQGISLNSVGWYHALLGQHEQARICCEQALAILQELGDRSGEAHTWDSLGYSHLQAGRHEQAIGCFQRAVDLFEELGARPHKAESLDRLGDTRQALGEHDAARAYWQEALAIYDELGTSDAEPVRAKLRDR